MAKENNLLLVSSTVTSKEANVLRFVFMVVQHKLLKIFKAGVSFRSVACSMSTAGIHPLGFFL